VASGWETGVASEKDRDDNPEMPSSLNSDSAAVSLCEDVGVTMPWVVLSDWSSFSVEVDALCLCCSFRRFASFYKKVIVFRQA